MGRETRNRKLPDLLELEALVNIRKKKVDPPVVHRNLRFDLNVSAKDLVCKLFRKPTYMNRRVVVHNIVRVDIIVGSDVPTPPTTSPVPRT